MRNLHLGLTPWVAEPSRSGTALVDQAERAEDLGFDSFWLPESHFTARGAVPAPLISLAAVAGRTQRLRLGTTSYLLTVRNPLQVAEEVAVLDQLSGGRVILGVGRGMRPALFAAYQVPPAEKRDRFEAALEQMQRAWRGEPLAPEPGPDPDGGPITLAPLPAQTPHPPLWAAAFGPRAIAQAGRLGLPYLASPMEPLAALEENYARHREAGGAREASVPVMRTVFVTHDPALARHVLEGLDRQSRAMARSPVKSVRRSADADPSDRVLVGSPDQVAESVERYRSRLGVTHLIARTRVPGASEEQIRESLQLISRLRA